MSSNENRRFGQYELRQILGRGGMATVYRAYQPNLDREVAIKVMSNQFVDDATFIQRFKREARSIGGLHHPNILSVYDTGEENGVPYIVTELIDGQTLRERLGKPIDLRLASKILNQLASALDYAHERGIVHRDVKPSNVLMGNRDRAVLSDFGIVKLLQEQTANLTATGFGVGTPEYMSPEQGSGEPLDGRSDLYSLGVILYEMLTGVTPFRSDTPLAIIMSHLQRPLPDPTQFNPTLSSQVVTVLNKALAKNRNDRYSTGADFAAAFDEAVAATLRPVDPKTQAIAVSDKTQLDAAFNQDKIKPTVAMNAPDGRDPNRDALTTTLSAPAAYMMALQQEQNGNYQAAYETLVDVQRREPAYRDVPTRLQRYEQSNYHYTGQFSLYAKPPIGQAFQPNLGQNQLAPGTVGFNAAAANIGINQPYVTPTSAGTLTPPPVSSTTAIPTYMGGVTPPTNYGFTPPPPSNNNNQKKSNRGLLIGIIGGVAALVIIAAVAAFAFVLSPKNNPTVTPTVVAAVTITANPPITSATTSIATTNPVTSVATTAPTTQATTVVNTTVATTALVVTTAPRTTSKPATAPPTTTTIPTTTATTVGVATDPAVAQVKAITDKLYGPNGDLATSIQQLKQVVKQYPSSGSAQLELGQALYLWNHEAGEVEALKAATKINPKNARSWAILTLAYRDNYQLNNALDAGSRAIELDPNNADAHAAYALALAQNDDIERAKTQRDAALKLDPAGLWTLWAAFGIDLSTGEDDSGIGYIEQLIKRYPLMATFPNAKGDYYSELQKYDDAIVWYKKAITLDPGYAYAHGGLGWAYYDKGDYTTARKEFQTAISQNDNYAYAHDGYGFILNNDGSYDEAVKQLNRSIIIDPRDALAYNGLATAYISKGRGAKDPTVANGFYNQSITSAKSAIQYNASYADAYFHVGEGYYQLKQYDQAEEPFKQAIAHNSSDDIASYHSFLAYTYYNEKKIPEAKSEVSKALAIDPNNKDAKDLQAIIGK